MIQHGWATLVAAVAIALPAAAAAQQPPTQGPPGAEPTELVFEREVFQYPDYERRNPFRRLVSDEASGPRFEQLGLLGIVYSSDPSRSVALFGRRGGGGETDGGETFRLRVGDVLGNIRVLGIDRTQVLIEVEEFGMTEQRVLELSRGGQGGGSR